MMVKLLVITCFMVVLLSTKSSASDLDDVLKKYLDLSSSQAKNKISDEENALVVGKLFHLFKAEYKHSYDRNSEQSARFEAFQKSLKTIQHIAVEMKGKSPFTVGLNKFSDWTPDELSQLRGYRPPVNNGRNALDSNSSINVAPTPVKLSNSKASSDLPTSFDYTTWVVSGTTTPVLRPVKDQVQCGSCYAFAFVCLLEFQYALQHKSSQDLSEQQFVDCSASNYGCGGGNFPNSWSYLVTNKYHVDSTQTYPYQARAQNCHSSSTSGTVLSGLGSWSITTDKVAQMRYYLVNSSPIYIYMYIGAKDPISGVSSATNERIQNAFQGYKSGVFDTVLCQNWKNGVNHIMVVVGYGVDASSGLAYWKVRNSWGSGWGDKGYISLRSGVNLCGIETELYFISKS